MTFLQLSSRLRQEVGGSGTGPTAVTGQTGEYRRIVDWIASADEDIQRMHNEWRFMRSGFTVNTVTSDGSYLFGDCTDTTSSTPITNFRDWCKDSLKIYLTSSGVGTETPLYFIEYQDWYDIYNTGTQTDGQPICFTIGNDLSIKLGPKPNDVYTLTGEYQKSAVQMTANSDIPAYPSEYHMIAVYRAMMKYGRYTGATEVYQDGKNEYKAMLKEMRRTQLPRTKLGQPLV